MERWRDDAGFAGSEPLQKLIGTARFHRDMHSLLNALTLGEEADILRAGGKNYAAGAVTLMTLHGAKGLEFPAVFLCGACKGTLPLEMSERAADLAEERRLFYVGITRARDELILTYPGEPSPFLAEIPSGAVTSGGAAPKKLCLKESSFLCSESKEWETPSASGPLGRTRRAFVIIWYVCVETRNHCWFATSLKPAFASSCLICST